MAEAVQENKEEEEDSNNEKLPETFFIAFNEVCSADTTFQCTAIFTKSEKDSFTINSTKNLVFKDLYNAGQRMTATTKLENGCNEFYALIHKRDTDKKLDETRIQKYKLIKNKDGNEFNIEFIKEIGVCFQGQGVNSEGLTVIESDNDNEEYKGFLIVNDLWCKPTPNSNLYFINNKMESKKIIHSFNDKGVAELNDICIFNGFDKNGYLILPQSLNLGYIDDDKKNVNWSLFEKWSKTNDGAASIFFIDKQSVLKAINNMDENKNDNDDNKDDNSSDIVFERIPVYLEDNFGSNDSVFHKFGNKEDGYITEGFESLAVDENNNMMLILEHSKNNDTFNFILTARFEKNQKKNDELEIYIDPCKYTKIENNGAGTNYAQEALLYVKNI